ncbi:hypothetical protein DXT63_10805 [Thermoanaerobacteraceae bacterium SP2]|nr:hypothetical protein DXT63_10805 [Thermoanaerobacteraceae bacterium SP2]
MFGYIKPYKPEMKIKEYEVFKAYYCGLCKELGKRYGLFSRFSLNYEHTFLAIVLSALSDESIDMKLEPCIAHPFGKRPVIKNNEYIAYAADMNILLTYYKFQDMKKDEKKFPGTFGSLAFYNQFKKARSKYPEKAFAIEQNLRALDALERERCASIDKAAEPFANLMKEILPYPGMKFEESIVPDLEHIAYNLGRFIYIIDAYDDIEKDMKNRSYNPILLQFGKQLKNNEGGDPGGSFFRGSAKEEAKEWVCFNLTFTLSLIDRSFEKLEFKKNRGIIENVVKIGLYKELERIMKGDKKCKTRMKF